MVPVFGVPLESEGIDLGPLLPHHLSEIVVGIVLLLVIFVVMWKLVVPKFEELYDQRTDAIEGGMERAQRAQDEADRLRAEYEIRLAEAQEEAAQIREKAKVQGEVIIAEARDAATAESARITETARVQIAAERVQAVNKLKTEVGTLATTLAGKIVGEALEDDERSRRTVDRFLADLESQQVSN